MIDGMTDEMTDNPNPVFVGYNKSGTFICKDKHITLVSI